MRDNRLRFAVNLSILFTELPLLDRPRAAAACGFDAAEMWWPFPERVPEDREFTTLQQSLDNSGIRLVALNFDAGDMISGDRGLLSLPNESARFRANVEVAVGLAEATGCPTLNALYGNRNEDVEPEAQDALAAENLAIAAEAAERIGATITVEALNTHENPRYPLASSADALALIEHLQASGVKNVRFQADLYHQARMGEDPISVVRSYGDRIGHVQIADVPGRNQPGTGTMPFDRIFEALERHYAGYVGLEYKPLGPSGESFDWLPVDQRAIGHRESPKDAPP